MLFQVLYGERKAEEVFQDLDAIWDPLLRTYPGILQVDDIGYFDQTGKLLSE